MKKIVFISLLDTLFVSCIPNKDLIYLQNKDGKSNSTEVAHDDKVEPKGWKKILNRLKK